MGINVASSFTRNAAVPLDDSTIVADITARDAIPSGVRYIGFSTFCLSDGKNYQLVGGITNSDWKKSSGGGGGGGGGGASIKWASAQIDGAISEVYFGGSNVFNFPGSLGDAVTGLYKVPKSYEVGTQKKLIIQVYLNSGVFVSKKFKFSLYIQMYKQGSGTINTRTNAVEIGPISSGGPILYNVEFDLTDSSGQINSVNLESNNMLVLTLSRVAASSDELTEMIYLLPENTEVYDV